jgi:hypothetical protein
MQVGQSPAPTGSPIYNAYPYTGLAVVCANDDIDRYSSLISSGYAGVIVPTTTAANTNSATGGVRESNAGDHTTPSTAASAATGLMVLTMPQVIEEGEGLTTPNPTRLGGLFSSSVVTAGGPETGGSRHGHRSASVVMPYASDTDEEDMMV